MEKSPAINLKLFHDYIGHSHNDIEFMIDLFIEQSTIYYSELEIALHEEDQQEWHDIAHKFKGMASFTGANDLYKTCQTAQEKYNSNLETKKQLLKSIEGDIDKVIRFFRDYKRTENPSWNITPAIVLN